MTRKSIAALALALATLMPFGARAMCEQDHATLSCPDGHSWNPDSRACEAMSS